MATPDPRNTVPQQETGSSMDTEYAADANSVEHARQLYENAKRRLLNVNRWHQIAGKATAVFKLTDANGNEVERDAQQHDYFMIDIPGPGPVSGDGYDWVQVEGIVEHSEPGANTECVVMNVRPAPSPKNDDPDIAHFFSEDATSNFIVRRENNKVIAGVYGRNEVPNTRAGNVVDKARNAAIGLSAVAGVSKLQWSALVKGIIEG
jgi:hypothetical protein